MPNQLILNLSHGQLSQLNVSHPPSKGPNEIGERAFAIVQCYFFNIDPRTTYTRLSSAKNSFHFEVTYIDSASNQKVTKEILVKGTNRKDWIKSLPAMRITGQNIYKRITNGNVAIFRVIKVNSNTPDIWEICFPQDFRLKPDDRWRGEK